MKNMLKKIRKNSERGQAIILVAFAIIGLVAIVGLMTDGGIVLIEYARLKRGIDSASIAAAAQFRKNFVANDIKKAGEELLKFNQATSKVTIFICDPAPHPLGTVADKGDDATSVPPGAWNDPDLCPAAGAPARKLVRVEARRHVDFGFMRVLGINGTDITASSIGEAASIDMVLVIDTSTSMAYETVGDENLDSADPSTGSAGDDPEACNALMGAGLGSGRCEPLGKVVDAAVAFVNDMFFPYDRVALIATTGQSPNSNINDRVPVTVLDFNDNYNDVTKTATQEVQNALHNLKVYQPNRCSNAVGTDPTWTTGDSRLPCLQFNQNGDSLTYYRRQTCPARNAGESPVTCGPSNIGGGLYEAGFQYANARQDSFWVTVALFGGPANASNPPNYPDGKCPGSSGNPTWKLPGGSGFCRDEDDMPASYSPPNSSSWDAAGLDTAYTLDYMQNFDWTGFPANWPAPTRHHFTVVAGNAVYPSGYDADDFARDGADFIAAPSPNGQGATLFSICMGTYCRAYPNVNDPASGEMLGRYMALQAGDSTGVTANHGLYFYAENSSVVANVFTEIAKNIFTRISQ
jgi:hypothetical protein